jgi:tetratricopeptide (TPR) repeat protein
MAQQHLEHAPASLQAMAELLLEEGHADRAAWCLREAIRLEPALPRVRVRLAQLAADGGQPHRAVELMTEEVRKHPGDVQAWVAYGDLLTRMRRGPEAAEKYRRAIELDPDHAIAHWRLGSLALAARRLDEACSLLDRAVALDPDQAVPRVELAHARLERGETTEAARLLELHMERHPPEEDPRLQHVTAAIGLAELALRAGQSAAAARVLTASLRHPTCAKDAGVLRKLALARYRCGDLAGGDQASRRLHRVDPSDRAAAYNLALSALQRGELPEARTWIRAGLAAHPRDGGLRRLRIRLWMLQLVRPWRRTAEGPNKA